LLQPCVNLLAREFFRGRHENAENNRKFAQRETEKEGRNQLASPYRLVGIAAAGYNAALPDLICNPLLDPFLCVK
jgi:hypothetical protein